MKPIKILHRIYFDNFPPYEDRFLHYLETWKQQLPDYEIMLWNASNLDTTKNEWLRRSVEANDPVFLGEYFRWELLQKYGGIYLDADCEILDGKKFNSLIEDLFASDEYDAFTGVEHWDNGCPTAQTIAAKPDSQLVKFMLNLYENPLSGPLWHWRTWGLIGPQLMSLYFMENGKQTDDGFFPCLESPEIVARVKIYPQEYFSPKFAIDGKSLAYTSNTCIYHLFANLNNNFPDKEREEHRRHPLLFNEYTEFVKNTPLLHSYSTIDNAVRLSEKVVRKFYKVFPRNSFFYKFLSLFFRLLKKFYRIIKQRR